MMMRHLPTHVIEAVTSWVRNNAWFQSYQSKMLTGVQSNQAAMDAQDLIWPDRKNVMSQEQLLQAANGLEQFYGNIVQFLSSPTMPAGTITQIHRGHALDHTAFANFLTGGFAGRPLLRSYSIDDEFVPYFYAGHNFQKLVKVAAPENIVPYILHVELNPTDQALLWVPSVATRLSAHRDDRWQAELIAPTSFDVQVLRVHDENCSGCIVKHVYAKQK